MREAAILGRHHAGGRKRALDELARPICRLVVHDHDVDVDFACVFEDGAQARFEPAHFVRRDDDDREIVHPARGDTSGPLRIPLPIRLGAAQTRPRRTGVEPRLQTALS
jgi:hypothetical protein